MSSCAKCNKCERWTYFPIGAVVPCRYVCDACRNILPKFQSGDVVQKVTGDYKFVGNVTVIRKRSGEYRYAVENDDGMIHIFNGSQLELVK